MTMIFTLVYFNHNVTFSTSLPLNPARGPGNIVSSLRELSEAPAEVKFCAFWLWWQQF